MPPFPAFSTLPFLPTRGSSLRKCPRRHCPSYRPAKMSGVNGGIDYEIDLSALPKPLSMRIADIQRGPDSPTELINAATEIAQAAPSHPQTLPVLVDMLGFNNPVAANIAITALSDAGKLAIPSLLRGVAAFNYAVNAYALRALALIGDPAVADVALACAARGPIPNVRRAACRALAALRYDNVEEARRGFELLVRLADAEPDWGVRYAAIAGLQTFFELELVGTKMVEEAMEVLRIAAEGGNCVRFGSVEDVELLGEEVEREVVVPSDPSVAARAAVALEGLELRVGAVAQV